LFLPYIYIIKSLIKMRLSIIISLIICIIASCDTQQTSPESKTTTTIDTLDNNSKIEEKFKPIKPDYCLKFENDSGYILAEEGKKFLYSASLSDTFGGYWDNSDNAEIAGKYYKTKSNSIYLCIRDLDKEAWSDYFLMEILSDGSIVNCEKYSHGNYECCWGGKIGFFKINDFYCFKSCGTGSGYCGTQLYIFKKIIPQESQNPIYSGYLESIWGKEMEEERVSSSIKAKGDTIVLSYQRNRGKRNEKTNQLNITASKKFTVMFLPAKDGVWYATDSTEIRDFLW